MAPGQVHRHLARERNVGTAALGGHVREPDPKMFSYLLLNLGDGYRSSWPLRAKYPATGLPAFARSILARSTTGRSHPRQRAFQTADIGSDSLCQKRQHLSIKLHREGFSFFTKNSQSSLQIRLLQFCG